MTDLQKEINNLQTNERRKNGKKILYSIKKNEFFEIFK